MCVDYALVGLVQQPREVGPVLPAQLLLWLLDSVDVAQVHQNQRVHFQHLLLYCQVAHLVDADLLTTQLLSIGLVFPDDPQSQVCHQLVGKTVPLQPVLVCDVGEAVPLVAQAQVLPPVLLGQELGEDQLPRVLVHTLVAEAEAHTVVLVIGVCEAVPDQQEPVAPPAVAVEQLLAFLVVLLGCHDEVAVLLVLALPPLESDVLLELPVDHGLGLLELAFRLLLDQLSELPEVDSLLDLLLAGLVVLAVVVLRVRRGIQFGLETLGQYLLVDCFEVGSGLGVEQSLRGIVGMLQAAVLEYVPMFVDIVFPAVAHIGDGQLLPVVDLQHIQIKLLPLTHILLYILGPAPSLLQVPIEHIVMHSVAVVVEEVGEGHQHGLGQPPAETPGHHQRIALGELLLLDGPGEYPWVLQGNLPEGLVDGRELFA